jgi:hypothetical protein
VTCCWSLAGWMGLHSLRWQTALTRLSLDAQLRRLHLAPSPPSHLYPRRRDDDPKAFVAAVRAVAAL